MNYVHLNHIQFTILIWIQILVSVTWLAAMLLYSMWMFLEGMCVFNLFSSPSVYLPWLTVLTMDVKPLVLRQSLFPITVQFCVSLHSSLGAAGQQYLCLDDV